MGAARWILFATMAAGCTSSDPGPAGDCAEADRVRLYPDSDGDGFGDARSPGELMCAATAGYVVDHTDCADTDPLANPLQATPQANNIKNAALGALQFDYNCDGVEVKSYEAVANCLAAGSSKTACTNGVGGWSGGSVPLCGATLSWVSSCAWQSVAGQCYEVTAGSKQQTCL